MKLFHVQGSPLPWPNVISALFYPTLSHTPMKNAQIQTMNLDSEAARGHINLSVLKRLSSLPNTHLL